MKRTALYCRVSTEQQAKEGDSIQAQLDALRKYAKEHNLYVVGSFIDDGISGTKFQEREKLQELIELIKGQKVDLVLVTKLDRLFRSLKWYIMTQEVFNENGVDWRAIWEPIYDSSTPQGRLIINQMMSISQFEAEHTAQRIDKVFDYKKSKREVLSGKIPFGYKIVDKHMVPDEEKAKIARKVFDLYIETGNICEVIRLTEGYGLPRSQRGLKWMLQNRKYIGEAYGYTDYCEPIIDERTFYLVQDLLSKNVTRNQIRDYVFTGMIVCKDCGKKMVGTTDLYKRTGTRYKIYRCFQHYRTIKMCPNSKQINEHKLEKYLLQYLEEFAIGSVDVGKDNDAVDYKKLIANAEKKMGKLKDLYLNDLISLEEYKKDVAEYQKQINDYTHKMSDNGDAGRDEIMKLIGTNVTDWYWTLDAKERRILWRSIIKEISFDHNRSIEVFFR